MADLRGRVAAASGGAATHVVHVLPGRLRVRLADFSHQLLAAVEARLRRTPGVTSAVADPLTRNILIHFTATRTNQAELLAVIASVTTARAQRSHHDRVAATQPSCPKQSVQGTGQQPSKTRAARGRRALRPAGAVASRGLLVELGVEVARWAAQRQIDGLWGGAAGVATSIGGVILAGRSLTPRERRSQMLRAAVMLLAQVGLGVLIGGTAADLLFSMATWLLRSPVA
ncbi:MAG: hypothetical protein NVSMB42_01730 [Herpetosiphon sp.]